MDSWAGARLGIRIELLRFRNSFVTESAGST